MFDLEAVTEALGSEIACSIAGKTEGSGDRRTEKRITERIQHQRKRALGDVVGLVPNR